MRMNRLWICLLLAAMVLASCRYAEPDYSSWELTREQRDSLEFRASHHYGVNYNFKVLADSLPLRQMLSADSLWVCRDDVLVVADYAVMTTDTTSAVWIKVARDQDTMGWILEGRLLDNVVPLDPISRFIHLFSSLRTRLFLVLIGTFILCCLYRRARHDARRLLRTQHVDSIYPALLCCCVVLAATLYAGIRRFAPELWAHYYFNPSLDPFALPPLLGLFVILVWAMVLLSLALVDDLFHQAGFATSFFYLLGLGTLCTFLYMFVTWSVYYYVGYALVAAFLIAAVRHLVRICLTACVCGHCGARLSHKGVCPRCGCNNE